jgi:hypothetical protein
MLVTAITICEPIGSCNRCTRLLRLGDRAYLADLGLVYCSRRCAVRDLGLHRKRGNGVKAVIAD